MRSSIWYLSASGWCWSCSSHASIASVCRSNRRRKSRRDQVVLRRIILFAALAAVITPSGAIAQQTREEQRAEEQAQKATDLHPYVPTPLERQIARGAR